ncbi:MAG: Asp-tRNA(Asn)/Glu-tRNA(Gln) amidotransferase GatCAB subunit C [Alphaproteobacteria bacterium]|nr:Asp-tRNA(Asn)/Glu-tRNA(Gln) amidotransferase GatCAB subunit C [Alphaproteobacteria bacterium]|tara:strand:+ start:55952 stop:56254 length:303 start_codon:yes stop_codon:yes gene_type:complete
MSTENTPSIMDIAKKTARLARLRVSEEDLAVVAPQLEKILGLFEELQTLDTDNVEPLANVIGQKLQLREDEITDGDCQDKVLSNAPDTTQGFYGVPKVVE